MKKKALCLLLCALMAVPFFNIGVHAAQANAAPTVIPAIREWNGATGTFRLGDTVTINTKDAVISEGKQDIIRESFLGYLGVEASFAQSGGDIVLVTDKSDEGLGKDGYTMEVTLSAIIIKAPEDIGLLYGIYTVLQSVKADGFVPCGTARDYSYYEVRSCMLDVARAWTPLDYVEEITKYMAFFKLNEFHLHINDAGRNDYSAFRLESDVPGLTSQDGHYTKDEYRAYQKRMLEYGVEIVTEIDTPAHSRCFREAKPGLMMDGSHLDITNPDVLPFIKNLFDEYITGDDPVFVSKRVHIGTDEYPDGYDEYMRKYTDELIDHVNSRGYTPRFWGGFGKKGFGGTTPISPEAEVNFWTIGGSDYKLLFDMGFDIVNSCGSMLYIVPGGNAGFADYLDLESLYSSWYVNYMGKDAASAVDPDHPQLLGGSLPLWNDLHTEYSGFSIYDIFDRFRGGICFIAEKTWCGEQTRDLEASDFVARYDKLSSYAPQADPGRHNVETINGTVPAGVTGFGWPYVASMDITVDSIGEGFTILGGEAGQLYVEKDGKVSFQRGVYKFRYKCKLPEGKTTNLKIVADKTKTVLIVDGVQIYEPSNTKNASLTRSSTFVLPLEKIGEGLDGKVENLTVEGTEYDISAHVMEKVDRKAYKELTDRAMALVAEGAPASLQEAVEALESCLKEDVIYDFQLETLSSRIEEEITAYETAKNAPASGLILWIGIGVAAVAAIAVVLVVLKKKK